MWYSSKIFFRLIFLISFSIFSASCSSSRPEINNQKSPASRDTTLTDVEVPVDSGDDNANTTNPRPGFDADTELAETASLFCQRAAETEAVKQKLSEYLQKLCHDDQPRKLLTDTLIAGAWDGGATEPKLFIINPWDNDTPQTTTGFFAITIKLPVPISDYFDKVGPLAGDIATINKITMAAGATPEITEVIKSHSQDGKYHTRGWTIEQKSSEDIEAGSDIRFQITTHVTSRSDHYELHKDKAYLFTSYLTDPDTAITVKRFDSLAAGLQVGSDSYFMAAVRVTSDNKSFPDAARRAIRAKATHFIKSVYKMAYETMSSPIVSSTDTKSTTSTHTDHAVDN